jgi:ABC-type nickel/cobalt efflux system permease component RcnA
MTSELAFLLATAATIGVLHTLMGPDHYVPFVAMAGARDWSLRRTLGITTICGIGHVLGSVVLGTLGIALGWAVGGLEWLEAMRGEVAAWLLLGFGLAYTAWGLRAAIRNRPHVHWHSHADGTVHEHTHTHHQEHSHVHEAPAGQRRLRGTTPWVLFVIFVFGPCEALIPMLMVPAASGSWWGVAMVVAVFGVVTVATMIAAVTVGYLGVSRLALGSLERYSHALAGLALVACGLAIQLGL